MCMDEIEASRVLANGSSEESRGRSKTKEVAEELTGRCCV